MKRVLECNQCHAHVQTWEINLTDPGDDEFLDPETYVCGACLESAGAFTPDEEMTPQERADAQAAWAAETGDAIPYDRAVMG